MQQMECSFEHMSCISEVRLNIMKQTVQVAKFDVFHVYMCTHAHTRVP